MATAARILWTKQVRKKTKTYNDGFLLITANGQAVLFDEAGKELASSVSKLQCGLAEDPSAAEDLACFEGFLVQGDAPCHPADISAARGSSPGDSSNASTCTHAAIGTASNRQPATAIKHAGSHHGGSSTPYSEPPAAPQLSSRHAKPAGRGRAGPAPGRGGTSLTASGAAAGPGLCTQTPQESGLGSMHININRASTGGVHKALDGSSPHINDSLCDVSCAPTLQSDTDILQLLDSITASSSSIWQGSNGQAVTAAGAAPASQQQQLLQSRRVLPAVPQFGRARTQAPQQRTASMPQAAAPGAHLEQRPWPAQLSRQPSVHCNHQQQLLQAQHVGQGSAECEQNGGQHILHGTRSAGKQHWSEGCSDPEQHPEQVPSWGWRHKACMQQPAGGKPPTATSAAQEAGLAERPEQLLQALHCHSSDTPWKGTSDDACAPPAGGAAATGVAARGGAAAAGTWRAAALTSTVRAVWAAPQAAGSVNHSNSWDVQQQQQQGQPAAGAGAHQAALQQPAHATDAPAGKPRQQRGSLQVRRAPNMPAADPKSSVPAADSSSRRLLLQPPPPPPQQQQQQLQLQEPSLPQGYCYPGPEAGQPSRRVQVPTSFGSRQQYGVVLTAALIEEVNLQLAEQARTFYGLVRQAQAAAVQQQPAASRQPHHHHQQQQQQQQQQRLQTGARQSASADVLTRLQAACARSGLQYHPSASLTVYHNDTGSSANRQRGRGRKGWGTGRKRGRGQPAGGGSDAEDDDGETVGDDSPRPGVKAVSMYLTLPGKLDRRRFRKHDLWVLSNNPLLNAAAAPGPGPCDRLNQPWAVLARSLWHGPDRDGKMEVELLPGQQQLLPPSHKWQRQQAITALQGPDVTTDVQVAELISSSNTMGWQLLDSLIRPCSPAAADGGRVAADTAAAVAGADCGGKHAANEAAATVGDGCTRDEAGRSRSDMPAACPDAGTSTGQLLAAASPANVPSPLSPATTSNSSSMNEDQAAGSSQDLQDSGSSQEFAAVHRRKRRLQLSGDDGSDGEACGSAEADGCRRSRLRLGPSAGKARAAAATSSGWQSDSGLEDEFVEVQQVQQPGKRARKSGGVGCPAAAPASSSKEHAGSGLNDSGEACSKGITQGSAVAGAAAAGAADQQGNQQQTADAAAVQALLTRIVQRFWLNAAQAAVAEHVASWLPALMQEARQQQRQQGGRKLARHVTMAGLTAGSLRNTAGPSGSSAVQAAGNSSSSSSSSSRPPVCLIHGPFGSGKSSLLVALIHLLTGLAEPQGSHPAGSKKQQQQQQQRQAGPRILVAAHTNVAVDRVLLGLQEAGFTNMLRVGSLPRIAKQLLSVSLHSADDSRDALSQLQGMLQNAAGAEEMMIRGEIAAIQAGAERRRRKALSTAAVVGITCCSALQSTLEGQVFDVVLLDEASQMTEVTSLVPLLRVQPRYLIAAGDPCQLPPVLASPTAVTPQAQPPAAGAAAAAVPTTTFCAGRQLALSSTLSGNSSGPAAGGVAGGVAHNQQQQQQGAVAYGLLRPLFVRLTHLGHTPHLLTHQYRCHPMLSLLSNRHFYNSRLVDGVSAAQRQPLVPKLPALLLCDCQGGCSQAAGGGSRSSVNRAEASLVAQLVARLLCRQQAAAGAAAEGAEAASAGVEEGSDAAAPLLDARQLGVICFFRGQAALIKQLISAGSCPEAADVQVATVDSFQGAEKEVIILATTTTNPHSEFCSDKARLNVALTRARRHLIVVGAAAVLAQTPGGLFRELVNITSSGQHDAAAFMPGGSLLQLLAQQQ